jgi:isopenicillin-N epimerase
MKLPVAPKPLRLGGGEDARAGWPLEPGFLHLNHGSFGAVPRVALEAQDALKREMEALPVKWFINLPDRIAASRREISQRLSLDPERTAFVPNA